MAACRRTRSMAHPARDRALATSELPENIIVHLPARTILTRMLGVSRYWNDVINASPAIQTKLWRRPLSNHVSSPVGLASPETIDLPYGVAAWNSDMPMYSGSCKINAVFPTAPRQQKRYEGLSHLRLPFRPVYAGVRSQGKQLHHVVITCSQPSETSSDTASWLDMQLSEPPITTAWIEVFAGKRPIGSNDIKLERKTMATQATLRDSGGVTFGMVRDVAGKILASTYDPRVVRVAIRICFFTGGADVLLSRRPGRRVVCGRRDSGGRAPRRRHLTKNHLVWCAFSGHT